MNQNSEEITIEFFQACKDGNLEVVSRMLGNGKFNPTELNEWAPVYLPKSALGEATRNGRMDVVQMLLADPRVSPGANNYESIHLAVHHGHLDILKILMNDSRTDPNGRGGDIFIAAAANGYFEIFHYLLSEPKITTAKTTGGGMEEAMIQCCMFGHLEILKLILSALPNINLAFNDNEALRWACDGGKISIVKALMESRHPEVVPKPDFLVKALENGGERGVEIIKYLLNLKPLPPGSVSQELYVSDSVSPLAEQILDSTVTPTTDRELFIPSTTSPTAGEGYTMTTDIITQSTPPLPSTSSMVQEYIPPQIIDPSFNDNILIQMAAQKRYMELVEMLLLDPRIDPAANNNKLFHTAVETGNTNLLQLLLIDGRIKISREDIDQGFRLTSKNDKLSAFELLLKDPRASPLPTFRECLVGLLDIAFLELLIQDVRVDPSERDNFAIKHSIKNGRMELFEPLFSDPRVAETVNLRELVQLARSSKQDEIAEHLETVYKEELLCLEEQVRQNVGAENSVQERKASTKDQEVYEKNNEHAQNEDKPIPEKLTDLVVNNHQTLTTGEDPDHLIPVKTKKKETVIGCRCVIV